MGTSGLLLFALAGCSGIGVNLTTAEPLNVNVNVKLDVYQHADTTVQKKVAAASADLPLDAQTRRRNRMGEVQKLKNSRTVGENHLGLLVIRDMPPGEYGDYTKETVDAENNDRTTIMQQIAKKANVPLAQVQEQEATLAAKRAFSGEWIEQAKPDGTYEWVQKGQSETAPTQ